MAASQKEQFARASRDEPFNENETRPLEFTGDTGFASRDLPTITASELSSFQPNTIVLFEDWITPQQVGQELNLKPIARLGVAGPQVMSVGGRDEPRVKLGTILPYAAMELSEAEQQKLEKSKGVAGVYQVRERHLPKPIRKARVSRSVRGGMDERAGNTEDYLRGVRDGIDHALDIMRRGSSQDDVSRLPLVRSQNRRLAWHLESIGIASTRFATGRGISVAVLDTGIDPKHPDFLGKIHVDVNAVSFVPNESVDDRHGHGTHCAGLVAGPVNASGGCDYGVAPDAELLVGKVLANNGNGRDDWILDGIQWAMSLGARIISMSLGTIRKPGERPDRLYADLSERLLDHGMGILMLAATGNESKRPRHVAPVNDPAAAAAVVAVAAVGRDGSVASFSNGNSDGLAAPDVAAPGVGIYSAYPVRRGGVMLLSGTSMATPMIAGVAALMLSEDAALTARALREKLFSGAKMAGLAADVGAGLVRYIAPR